jgi:hypothetical protein
MAGRPSRWQLRAADGHQAAPRLGYETLVREVSDSLHLRRFCLPLTEGVPDESTVRKLVRRLGPRASPSSPGR